MRRKNPMSKRGDYANLTTYVFLPCQKCGAMGFQGGNGSDSQPRLHRYYRLALVESINDRHQKTTNVSLPRGKEDRGQFPR